MKIIIKVVKILRIIFDFLKFKLNLLMEQKLIFKNHVTANILGL